MQASLASRIWYIHAGESSQTRLHECTNVWYSLLDGASDDELVVRPKHVEQNNEK